MSQALKEKRKATGLTQAQTAKFAGITERGYRRYEASDTAKIKTFPDIRTAIRIADALGVVDLRELWDAKDRPSDYITGAK